MKGLNERKVNYNKGIREIYWIGHLVKTNPIQSQTKPILFSPQIYLGVEKGVEKTKPILFSPQIYLGVERRFEKTKPICGRAELAQSLI